MKIKVPELSLVVMVGVSGSGKSTFARKHFRATEIVSSDQCRGIVSDDENNQAATNDAFDLLHFIIGKRLKNGLLTVVDATNVQAEARKPLVKVARGYHCLPVAIVIDLPERVCEDRNKLRGDRNFGKHVVGLQRSQLKRAIKDLKREGFRHIFVLKSEEEVNAVESIVRDPLYNNKKHEHGPFDIIGDVHGCREELVSLLKVLGYSIDEIANDGKNHGYSISHPEGRRAIFVGDLVDRGPDTPGVLKIVMSMVNAGTAFCVPGNHDIKLHKKLSGRDVQLKHGLQQSMEQLMHETPEFIETVKQFIDGLVSHYVFDNGKLVVSHAGIREEMQGRGSGAVRSFCLYGETTGETDEFGLPVRYNWAAEYKGRAMVVYGHTPVPEAQWFNNTIDIDTGCVFGGKLTALRYPEREIISVPALKMYCEPSRPIGYQAKSDVSLQQQHDDLLDIDDVTGKRIITTKHGNNITVREENSIAALEVMSRFAVNPKWLIYLPPTMSPSETSELPGMLEHPKEAFGYFQKARVQKVVCEEKHMGSRAIVIVCKDEDAVKNRFGIEGEGLGICYTRTGREYFNDAKTGRRFITHVRNMLSKAGFWEKFETDWVCFDCELMPWSAKAQSLLKDQYASVGAAAGAALSEVVKVLEQAAGRNVTVGELGEAYSGKQEMIGKYTASYRKYCWPVNSLEDYKLAPFHILATEGQLHTDKDHVWHMENIKEVCAADDKGIMMATPYKVVELDNEASINEATQWWEELTAKGGEGMVVKPLNYISRNNKGLIQPAVKCRGTEYLRIIYGPEYTAENNIQRLRSRGLAAKRSLALREFTLGVEGLERFINKEPLRKVHECVFAVLALESEPVDPRL